MDLVSCIIGLVIGYMISLLITKTVKKDSNQFLVSIGLAAALWLAKPFILA